MRSVGGMLISPQVDKPLKSMTHGRETYGYLPGRRESPPLNWYQLILLGDRRTCE